MINLSEYYKPFDDAINQLIEIKGAVCAEILNMDEDDAVLNDFDYNSFIKGLEDTIALLKMKRKRYKYRKMSEDEFEQFLRKDSEGYLTVAREHSLRSYDTLQSISKKYDVPILTILNYNNIMKQDFEELKELGGTLRLPLKIKAEEKTVYKDLSVFDTHMGKNAWGRDISNELKADENGLLAVLDFDETLKQNLSVITGDYGTIPFYEEHTLNTDWGSDYPKEFLELFTRIKLERRLELEPRVQKVVDIKSTRTETGLKFDVVLYPVNVNMEQGNEINILAG